MRSPNVKVERGEGCTFACTGCGDKVESNEMFTLSTTKALLGHFCWDCHIDIGNGIDDSHDVTPRGDGKEGGWWRIGRYDSCRRRALWVRFVNEREVNFETCIDAVELCAGREGDDAFARIEPSHPAYEDIKHCLMRAADHLDGRYDYLDEDRPCAAKKEGA